MGHWGPGCDPLRWRASREQKGNGPRCVWNRSRQVGPAQDALCSPLRGRAQVEVPLWLLLRLGALEVSLWERDSERNVGDCEEKRDLLRICLPMFDVWNLKPSVYLSPPWEAASQMRLPTPTVPGYSVTTKSSDLNTEPGPPHKLNMTKCI